MKKLTALLLTACFGIALTGAEVTSLREIRANAFTKLALDECKSCEIIYTVHAAGDAAGSLIFRQKTPHFTRIDILGSEETLSAGFDGQNFWGCHDQQNATLSEEEIAEYIYDVAFLAIPVKDIDIFSKLAADGTETVSGTPCFVYKATLKDDASAQLRLFASQKNGLLRRVILTSSDGNYITDFDAYTEKDGVLLPGKIYVSGVDDAMTLTLRKAVWNNVLDDALFSASGKAAVESATPSAETERHLNADTERRVVQLRTEIKVLHEKIAAESKKLDDLEKVYAGNQNQEKALVAVPPRGVRTHRHHYRRFYRRAMHYNRRSLRRLVREDKKLAHEYDLLSDKILSLRTELVKKQSELDALTGGKN